ncbi:hypothetical protein J8J14_00350 [Roseomonas sp. SSH11]|uniref:Uncharacterized protein n=1 Tax=Pararoseomonas baculiformis TaxID=2820812 RepID=A0ABS4AA89_9PROT|nr:hypothetical protein [Pararoseomonas baculiformis]MBP0443214.1 hypothetical protein [Pararoseomonas baculiformis]
MTNGPGDLGDAQSRAENAKFREMAQRQQAANPEYAYAPRWAPMGNWRMSGLDLFIILLGVGLILMVVGMRLLGVIG